MQPRMLCHFTAQLEFKAAVVKLSSRANAITKSELMHGLRRSCGQKADLWRQRSLRQSAFRPSHLCGELWKLRGVKMTLRNKNSKQGERCSPSSGQSAAAKMVSPIDAHIENSSRGFTEISLRNNSNARWFFFFFDVRECGSRFLQFVWDEQLHVSVRSISEVWGV